MCHGNVSIDYEKEWIVDSGCSHHATGDASLLSSVRRHDGGRAIVTADNSVHPVVNEGKLNIKVNNTNCDNISIDDVYHVPGLKKNLLSVPQITKSGRYVLFGPNYVKIIENIQSLTADVLFTGKKKESLFVMTASEAFVENTSRNDRASIWHARLGHIGYQLLQQISSKKLLEGIPDLERIHHDAKAANLVNLIVFHLKIQLIVHPRCLN